MTGDSATGGPAQLQLGGMPRRLYACTPSRLTTWLDCPRRYRMTYLDRPSPQKGPPWAHNSMGAAVHNALASWWRLPLPRRTVDSAGALVESLWNADGFRDDEQSTRWRARAREMVERYVADLDPADEPVGVERVVATRTHSVAVSGRVDRLDLRPSESGGGRLVVVDYKTGRRPLTSDDARSSLALALYALAASRVLRRPCRTVELHHMRSGGVASWEHQDEGLQRHLRRAESLAAECRQADEDYRAGLRPERVDEVFPPNPGAQCGWCDYARHCPEGLAARRPLRSWEGLGDADPTA